MHLCNGKRTGARYNQVIRGDLTVLSSSYVVLDTEMAEEKGKKKVLSAHGVWNSPLEVPGVMVVEGCEL